MTDNGHTPPLVAYKAGGWIETTTEIEADNIRGHLDDMLEHWLRPWTRPDPDPFRFYDLFPWWTRAGYAAAEGRRRCVEAWAVIRWGDTIHDEDY